ncbi:AAA family ATPase [Candidatus Halobeggiatoa sp. HSG11]|nr:AAA family ATPase [Candidatus Halobeggiatoa sp. HSG11]
MSYKKYNFENIKSSILDFCKEIKSNVEKFYVVRNIYSRFTIFYINKNNVDNVLRKEFEKNDFNNWIDNIEKIDEPFLLKNLEKESVSVQNNIYYSERRVNINSWFRFNKTEHKNIISFYSFKGGVGRTTSMILSAIELVRRGKKIVLIDFDLEAPGIVSLFSNENNSFYEVKGVLDFLIDINANHSKINNLNINDYYFSITEQGIIGTNGGELIIIPAAAMSFKDANNYIDKLSKVDLKYNQFKEFLPDLLFSFIQNSLSPDFILIDSRTGINEISGILLNRYSNKIFLVFYGNQQNMFGLESIVETIQYSATPFILVNSPVPQQQTDQREEINFFVESSYELIGKYVYSKEDNIPDISDETAIHYPINVPFSNTAVNLNSNSKLSILLQENGSENSYKKIANIIEFEEKITEDSKKINDEINKNELAKFLSKVTLDNIAASEDEFKKEEDLVNKFYPRRDYRYIFEPNKFLILGDKGTGKTALFSVLSHSNYAKHLANYCGVSGNEINNSIWITAFDRTSEFPSKANFQNLQSFTLNELTNYWLLLLIRTLLKVSPEHEHEFEHELNCKLSELKDIAKKASINEKIEEFLSDIDEIYQKKGRKLFFVYDYLDLNLPTESNFRGKCIGALLSIWYDYTSRFKNLNAKIFLRNDIFKREIEAETDKVKIINHSIDIKWTYDQLLNIVWKRLLSSYDDDSIRNLFEEFRSVIDFNYQENLGLIPNLGEEENRKLLELLLGKYMGASNKAFPYNWIIYHASDANKKMFPRSILTLFSQTGKIQFNDKKDSKTLIRPYNMEISMDKVSENRVIDLKEEYPELEDIFSNLNTVVKQFPIKEEELFNSLKKLKVKEPDKIIEQLNEIGVLYRYKYSSKKYGRRYHMPDLYLIGMKLKRRGPGAHKVLFAI